MAEFTVFDVPDEEHAKQWGMWLEERCVQAREWLKREEALVEQTLANIKTAAAPLYAEERKFPPSICDRLNFSLDQVTFELRMWESNIVHFEILANLAMERGRTNDLLGFNVRENLRLVDNDITNLSKGLYDYQRKIKFVEPGESSVYADQCREILSQYEKEMRAIQTLIEQKEKEKKELVRQRIHPLIM